mgnify:CR=1 FL=1
MTMIHVSGPQLDEYVKVPPFPGIVSALLHTSGSMQYLPLMLYTEVSFVLRSKLPESVPHLNTLSSSFLYDPQSLYELHE